MLNVHQALDTRQTVTMEYEFPIPRQDGTFGSHEARVVAIDDEEAVVIVRDITERQRAAESLHESERRFRRLFESAPIGIAVVREDRRIQMANTAFADMMRQMRGVEPDAIVGRSFSELELGGGIGTGTGRFLKLISGEIDWYHRTAQLRAPDGRESWADISTAAVRDEEGRFLYAIRMLEDITLRVHAVEGLRQSEARNRALLNALPDLLLVISADGVFLDVVEGTPGMTALPAGEFLGRNIREVLPPDFAEYAMRNIEAALGSKQPVTMEYEFPLPMDDGKRRAFEGRLVVSGEDEVVMIVRDITERLEVDRMKEQFLSTISHELRTPLTAIRGAVGLAASGQVGALPDKAQQLLTIARNNSERLSTLVNDIMDMERMAAGVIRIEREECSAADIAQQALESVLVTANEAEVAVHVGAEPIALVADPRRLVQALTNLLSNAVKFSDEGAGVTLRAFKMGDVARFEVQDQGRGIPQAELERIFDRFQQVDASDSRVHGGAGLGLAIVHWVVTQHGGRIWAESEEGRGSTFIMELPLTPDSEA